MVWGRSKEKEPDMPKTPFDDDRQREFERTQRNAPRTPRHDEDPHSIPEPGPFS